MDPDAPVPNVAARRPGQGESRLVDFPLVNSREALLWMVQMHCIDMNAWYSRVDKPDRPDFVLFDLDPPEETGAFALCVRVAHYVRAALGDLGLESWVKTSGSDGIHVVVPIVRRSTFEDTYAFAELLSRRLEAEHPGEVTTEWLKKKRSGVLVDHRQNGWGKTIASVYSVRPKPGAPVSTPLRWEELTEAVQPARLLDGGRARAGRGARRSVRAGAPRQAGARAGAEDTPVIVALDWVAASSIATAAATLVLALATFAAVRSANRAARVAERSLLANLRPLLMPSHQDDAPQKVGFQDDRWFQVPGSGAIAEATDEAVYLAIAVRNVGTGIAVLHGWYVRTEELTTGITDHAPLADFRRLTRDLYIAPGELGFWQGAIRDNADPAVRGPQGRDRGTRQVRRRGALRRPRARPARDHALPHHRAAGRGLGGLGRQALERRPARSSLRANPGV